MKTKKIFVLSFIACLTICNSTFAHTTAIDSIGTEVVNGKVVVLHRVEPKETLYAIHKKYGVSVSDITTMNPGSDVGLSVGQILKIPTTKTPNEPKVIKEISPTKSEGIKYHTVKPGETLYGVSKMYPCSVEDIKKWNELTSNALSVGQKLQISEGKAITDNTVETETVVIEMETTEEEIIEDVVPKTEIVKEEEIIIEETIIDDEEEIVTTEVEIDIETIVETEEKKEEPIIQSEENESIPSTRTADMGGYTKNFEKGYAELLSGTEEDGRYLAHHRTLPEGTILQVKNLANGKSVFVRIVGTFENDNPEVIIKLSSKAQLRLQVESPKFLTEISYIP